MDSRGGYGMNNINKDMKEVFDYMKKNSTPLIKDNSHSKFCTCGHLQSDHYWCLNPDKVVHEFVYLQCEIMKDFVSGTGKICGCKVFQLIPT